jgi:hypothetical protein
MARQRTGPVQGLFQLLAISFSSDCGKSLWNALVTMVCMKLHNLCIDRNMSVPLQHFVEDQRPGDEWLVLDNTEDNAIFF